MTYADRQKIPFVVLLGEDEIRENLVSVKDMQTGNQVKLAAEEAAAMIKENITARNRNPVVTET